VGCSNYPAWRLMQALWTADQRGVTRYDSLQPHYSLVHRAEFERELQEVCSAYGLGVIPYSPLAGGFLTGKYRRGQTQAETFRDSSKYFTDANFDLIELLDKLGQAKGGKTVSQMALAWMLTLPVITSPIIGPRNLEQLHDNLGAAGLRLEPDEMQALDQASAWDAKRNERR
jgi:aryl-alcohol dehydrogenase-like predicted oxidoreductase